MLRRRLNFASIACLVLGVALMGMWVRSYRTPDFIRAVVSQTRMLMVNSILGRLDVTYFHMLNPEPLSCKVTSFDSEECFDKDGWSLDANETLCGFVLSLSSEQVRVVAPLWFLVLRSRPVAMALRLRWPWRFTLRSLFIATTFLAIVLGMIAWLDKAWIGK